jgi:hypothetical protein
MSLAHTETATAPVRATTTPAVSTDVPRLLPGTPILVQRGNIVRVGLDPAGSLLLELDPSISAHSVAELLRSLADPCDHDTLLRRARRIGVEADDLDTVLRSLVAAGRTVLDHELQHSSFRVLIHGQGPIGDQLITSLGRAGIPARRTMRRRMDGTLDVMDTDLVVLTDFVIHDPQVVFALTRARIPHLLVRTRDGVGIIGPLVLPGLSSCLMCADRHRSDADPDWPALAVQLIRVAGHAAPTVVTTTATIAHGQIERLLTAVGGQASGRGARPEPQLLNRVLEFRDDPARLDTTRWSPHPDCDCRPAGDPRVRSSIV